MFADDTYNINAREVIEVWNSGTGTRYTRDQIEIKRSVIVGTGPTSHTLKNISGVTLNNVTATWIP